MTVLIKRTPSVACAPKALSAVELWELNPLESRLV